MKMLDTRTYKFKAEIDFKNVSHMNNDGYACSCNSQMLQYADTNGVSFNTSQAALDTLI